MTTVPYLKPLPQVSEENRPFWDGLRQREFRAPRCNDCGDFGWVPYPACRACFSTDLEWVPLSGDGVIYSYSVVHRGPGAFSGDVPYVLALVELTERPQPMLVLAQLDGCPPDQVRIGLPVKVTFHDIPGEDVTLYRFAPVTIPADA
jgi:uncharacterized OB-fold protein